MDVSPTERYRVEQTTTEKVPNYTGLYVTVAVLVLVILALIGIIIWLALSSNNNRASSSRRSSSSRTSATSLRPSSSSSSSSSNPAASIIPPPPKEEVFNYNPSATGYAYNTLPQAIGGCSLLGARIAATEHLQDGWNNGAQWCRAGWLADFTKKYPMHEAIPECGDTIGLVNWNGNTAGATCYGVKPPEGTPGVAPFNGTKWSMYSS